MSRLAEINSIETEALAASVKKGRGLSLTRAQALLTTALALLVILGFGLRLRGIEQIGFAEDEINKLEAVRAYERGDISPNAEHPMLMKALMYASMQTAHAWNARRVEKISDEASLRFPNIVFGALTVIPIFLLTAALFDRRTALAAAAFWAFGINAITYNRIAKEDTLLVFFMLFGFYFYLRAKQTINFDIKLKRRYYGLSGAAFGLMMASKYFPHYFGLNMLYHHLYHVRERQPGEPQGKTPLLFYICVVIFFLVANPAVFLPQTWQYLNAYTSEKLLTHTGYLMGAQLYKNNVSATPFRGTPFYFYALFLAIKVPIPVILAFVVGLVQSLRRWRHPGYGFLLLTFALWIVPYSLFGSKWLRYTLSLMPFVYMIAAVGLMVLIRWVAGWFKSAGAKPASRFAIAVMLLVFMALPAWTAYANGPHYALYTSALGAGRAGYFFPHDEFYDDGLREAISLICEQAPQGATIAHETPAVLRYYLGERGRTDLQSRALSDPKFKLEEASRPLYVIIQRGRTYFENVEKTREVRARGTKVYEGLVRGSVAVEVYKL
ncbi:MAG TPA: glycosyltransferase family 39 protein [Pyrinomonadaceae bacterium]